MSGSFVRAGDRMNFNNGAHFPTADPTIWNVDEDAVLDDLYNMLEDVEPRQYQEQLDNVSPVPDPIPNVNAYLPEANKLRHFDAQFPLTTNHAASMPMLATQEQSMKFNQMPEGNSRQSYQIQYQQSNPYAPLPRYPQNNTMCNPIPQNIPPALNIPPVDKVPPPHSLTKGSSLVTFVDLKTFYEKGQCRLQGKSEQRLDYASSFVRIYLENPENIKEKSAFVERSPDAAHIMKDNVGQIPLKILLDESSNWIKVNLDDAGSEVYKLSKVKGEERNLFRIGLKLLLKDTNKSKTFYSEAFQVKSKPKSTEGLCEDVEAKPVIKMEPDLKKRAIKRSRADEQELMLSSPLSNGSSVFPEVITDHLEATTANIQQLKVKQPIQTQRGDVAYHFKLKDYPKSIQLEEGDIIGLFENSAGKSEIRRLTCGNVRYAKLAGVISRSAWLEGKTPAEDEKDPTDVVCVIGVVKVKVRGPVQNGERIYASLSSYPGVAMPEHVISQVTSEELTLVGQSLESVKDESPDSVNLVSCFVSILLSIQTQHTNKALSDMRTNVLGSVDSKIAKAKKKLLRGLRWKAAILVTFLGLLGVLLYQLYAPLTAYRYWKCSFGSIDDSTSSFTFTTTNFQVPKVNGIEFHFDDLMDKLDANYKRKENDSTYRYYLNIDRCAAGGLKHGVRGPQFYVINDKCDRAYFYTNGTYRPYKSGRNFLCSFDVDSCTTCDTKEREPDIEPQKQEQNETGKGNGKEEKEMRRKQIRREECLSGMTRQRLRFASFKYRSGSTGKDIHAAGIQVTLDELRKKFNRTINEVSSEKSVRYYFNVKRCAKTGGGPQYFAVIGHCDNSNYYSESGNKWVKYLSGKDFYCLPDFS